MKYLAILLTILLPKRHETINGYEIRRFVASGGGVYYTAGPDAAFTNLDDARAYARRGGKHHGPEV